MSHAGIIGMRCAADDIVAISSGLSGDEWQTPSAAAGWTVHDVVIHVGALLELLQAAVGGEAAPDSGIEAINDAVVAQRRDWDPAHTLDNLNKQLAQGLPVFSSLQEEPMASAQTPMLDLGTYPLHAIADMFTFDMTTRRCRRHHRATTRLRGQRCRGDADLDERGLSDLVNYPATVAPARIDRR